MTELSNVMFQMEDAIETANIDNSMADRKLTSTESLWLLQDKKLIDYSWSYASSNGMNYGYRGDGKILDSKIPNGIIGFNGDIWVDNYKRGKIRLTSLYTPVNEQFLLRISENKYYKNENILTIMNGESSYTGKSILAKVSHISNKDDIVGWTNGSGEIISINNDINYYVPFFEDEDLIGIYGTKNYIDNEGRDYSKEFQFDQSVDTSYYPLLALNGQFAPSIFEYGKQIGDNVFFNLQTYYFLNNEEINKTLTWSNLYGSGQTLYYTDPNGNLIPLEPQNGVGVTGQIIVGGVSPYEFDIVYSNSIDDINKFLKTGEISQTNASTEAWRAGEGREVSGNNKCSSVIGYIPMNEITQKYGQNTKKIYYITVLCGYLNNTKEGYSLSENLYFWTSTKIKTIDLNN